MDDAAFWNLVFKMKQRVHTEDWHKELSRISPVISLPLQEAVVAFRCMERDRDAFKVKLTELLYPIAENEQGVTAVGVLGGCGSAGQQQKGA